VLRNQRTEPRTRVITISAISISMSMSISISINIYGENTVKKKYNFTIVTIEQCLLRSNREGYEQFLEWKRIWTANAKTEASIKTFMVENFLPFWLQCSSCDKWRHMPNDTIMTTELINTFKCDHTVKVRHWCVWCCVMCSTSLMVLCCVVWCSVCVLRIWSVCVVLCVLLSSYLYIEHYKPVARSIV